MLSEKLVDDRQLFATTIQAKIDLENHYEARRKKKSSKLRKLCQEPLHFVSELTEMSELKNIQDKFTAVKTSS